jgi:hypothetical protein
VSPTRPRSHASLVALPVGAAAVLHRAHLGEVEPLAELGPWQGAIHRISESGTRVASLIGEQLVEREVDGDSLVNARERKAPKGRRFDLAYHGERLFLAGLFEHGPREVPLLEALPNGDDYEALPVPEDADWKWVDALVPYGERLIAVDDLIWPRFLYDYVFEPMPTVRRVAELVTVLPAWRVASAAICGGWLCVLERDSRNGEASSRIGLYDPEDLVIRREYAALIGGRRRDSRSNGALRPAFTVAGDADHLWVASGRHGIGAARLRGSRPVSPLTERADVFSTLARRAVPSLAYRHATSGLPVVDLATVPGQLGCFALLSESDASPPTSFEWADPP